MENKIYNDDVERVVNNGHENRRKKGMAKYEKRRKKMFYNSLTFALIGILAALLGILEWLVPWMAVTLFFGFVFVASFLFGRFFENGKCRGWK